jgi:DNA-binding transcriptional ArsR family regulator
MLRLTPQVMRALYGPELAVVAHGLDGAKLPLPEPLHAGDQWRALLGGVARERAWGLLLRAVAEGAIDCSADQLKQAQDLARRAAMRDVRTEARMVATYELLRAASIDCRVLKGASTAARLYAQPDLRSSLDVDVLVPGQSFSHALALLEEAGGVRRYPEARPGFDRRFSKGTSLLMPDGISVDLHRTYVYGPYGFTLDLDGILSRQGSVSVCGRDIRCLELHDAAVHALVHAAIGDWPPRLVSLRDCAEFLQHPGLDHGELLRRIHESKVGLPAARSIAMSAATFGLSELPLLAWARSYAPGLWQRLAFAAYADHGNYRRAALAAAPFVPGSRSKAAYLWALLVPSRSYLEARGGSYPRWALHAFAALPRCQGELPRPPHRPGGSG